MANLPAMERVLNRRKWIIPSAILLLLGVAFFEWNRRNYIYPDFLKNKRTVNDFDGASDFRLWLWWAETKPWELSEWLWEQKKQRLEKHYLENLVVENKTWKAAVHFSPRKHWDSRYHAIQSSPLEFLNDGDAVFSRNLRFDDVRIPKRVTFNHNKSNQLSLSWEDNVFEFDLHAEVHRSDSSNPLFVASYSRKSHALFLTYKSSTNSKK